MERDQITDTVLMIEPNFFQYNADATETNSFMKLPEDEKDASEGAMKEFNNLADTLRERGIQVLQFPDTPDPHTPDAVFPNNWFSTHSENGGTVVLYPMCPPSRRAERRPDIIQTLMNKHGFQLGTIVDFSPGEMENAFLEGTGSLVLDRKNNIAYACLSPRTTQPGLDRFYQYLGYDVMTFYAYTDSNREQSVYHTNVVMSVGERFAVVCLDSIADEPPGTLQSSGHDIIPITLEQMHSFAGNMLQLKNPQGTRFIVMSDRARDSLTRAQITRLNAHGEIISTPLTTIEDQGGGSARCMLAEIFLAQKSAGKEY